MFPSSAIRILQPSYSQLVIIDPPFYSLAAIFLAVGILDLLVGGFIVYNGLKRSAIWIVAAIGVSGCLAGGGLLAPTTTISFSLENDQTKIETKYFGVRGSSREVPLSSIQKAVVETSQNARRLALILINGDVVVLDSYSSREGYYAAANAINAFIKSHLGGGS